MTTSTKSLVGPGRFQWNVGGWFGASLGGSAWMIVTAGFLLFHDQPALAWFRPSVLQLFCWYH